MRTNFKGILNQGTAVPWSRIRNLRFNSLERQDILYKATSLVAALGLGLVLGAILIYTGRLPRIWASLIIVATVTPTIVLLVDDIKKLVLVAIIVEIPLGLNIALENRPGHRGGPAGLLVSLMTIALIVGYIHWLKGRPFEEKSRFHHQRDITVPYLIYLFILSVSSFQTADKWFSFTQLFLEIQFFLMYFYIVNQVRTWVDVRLIFNTVAACLFLEGMIILAQYYLGFQPPTLGTGATPEVGEITDTISRVSGTFGANGANAAAAFLAASIAIAFTAFLAGSRYINKRLALIAIIPGLMALVLTGSRGGWIGFIVALLLIITVAIQRQVGTRIIMVFFFSITILVVAFSPIIIDRFTISKDERSARSRLWYSELALNFIREDMFTGAGANNQQSVLDDKDYTPIELAGKESLTLIHNKYLAVWVESGLFGFLAFLWVLLAGARQAWVSSKHSKDKYISTVVIAPLAALSVFMVHMTVATYTERRMQFIWLLLGLIAATSRMAKESFRPLDTK